MVARRVTAVVILLSFLALGVLSFLGNPVLSVVFIVVAGVVLGRHAVVLCPKCSNFACAFNPRAAKAGPPPAQSGEAAAAPFSDLEITRTTVVPLLATGPLAVIAAWMYSPVATVVVAAVALTAHSVFRKLTCSRCGNDCAGNCNARYREWRAAGKPSGG
jgi:hypothetical protein